VHQKVLPVSLLSITDHQKVLTRAFPRKEESQKLVPETLWAFGKNGNEICSALFTRQNSKLFVCIDTPNQGFMENKVFLSAKALAMPHTAYPILMA